MAPPKKILLLSNSELGQANPFLAVAHSIMISRPDIQVHIASYPALRSEVESTSAYAQHLVPAAQPIVFHPVNAMSTLEALANPHVRLLELVRTPPRVWTMHRILRIVARMGLPYTGEQLVKNYYEMERIVKQVEPDLAAVDCMFGPALTALKALGTKFIILSPNTLKDFCPQKQPRAAFFWKYPCVGSGYPSPVPWYLVPFNIGFVILLVLFFLSESHGRKAKKYLKEHTGVDFFGLNEISLDPSGRKMLVSCSPELDFPLDVIPANIISCGPILRAAPAAEDVDLELMKWISRGPTVLISLGTHAWTAESLAVELAGALRMLLDAEKQRTRKSELQVLWKLRQVPEELMDPRMIEYSVDKPGDKIYGILGQEIEQDRVRIVPWISPELHALQRTGHIICTINHGGANSFWDALVAGVPQVTLPSWADTFDFANRGEMLGVGRWGSRKAAPMYTAKELGPVLTEVVLGPGAENMRVRAKSLAKACAAKGDGRDNAAKAIIEELEAQ